MSITNTPNTTDWSQLETKGYVVVPSFLSSAEVDILTGDFHTARWTSNRHKYVLKVVSSWVIDRLTPKLRETAEQAGQPARLLLNSGCAYFSTRPEKNGQVEKQAFSFHQDRESFYIWQDHLRYLNFYIPLIKPVRDQSNLTVVPFDRLKARAPAAHDKLRGKGAHMLDEKGSTGMTEIIDESVDDNNLLAEFSAQAISETPQLGPGDLLLLRGDVVHKTEDADTDRVAVSFRMTDPDLVVARSRFASGGGMKYASMITNRVAYQAALDAFDAAGRAELTIGEFWPLYDRLLKDAAGKPPVSIARFMKSLTRDCVE